MASQICKKDTKIRSLGLVQDMIKVGDQKNSDSTGKAAYAHIGRIFSIRSL